MAMVRGTLMTGGVPDPNETIVFQPTAGGAAINVNTDANGAFITGALTGPKSYIVSVDGDVCDQSPVNVPPTGLPNLSLTH